MRDSRVIAAALPLLLILIAAATASAGCVTMGANPVPGECGTEWWKYVYSPERFVVLSPCVTVRGVVLAAHHPLDGDAILYVALDPEYARFASPKPYGALRGDTLELEIICKHPVFKFFVFRCWSCVNEIPVPRAGDHFEADGVYVQDNSHGHREIHPVTRLTILPIQ